MLQRPTLALVLSLALISTPLLHARPITSQREEPTTDFESILDPVSLTETVVDQYVPWPIFYGVQQTGVINSTFDCYGLFGDNANPWSVQVPGWPHAAFESPPGSTKEYLWMASLWLGGVVGGDTLVSHGYDDWFYSGREFRSVDHPIGSMNRFFYPTDYTMRAVFSDTTTTNIPGDYTGRPHIPLHVKVSNRSHIWRTTEYEDIIIYDLVLTNIGDLPIESAYLGFYADCDAGLSDIAENSHLDDLSGGIRERGIVYAIDNDGDPQGATFDELTSARKIFAVRLLASSEPLADTNFNWWLSPNTIDEDFGPRLRGTVEDPFFDFGTGGLGVPFGDVNKYYMLSHREWDYDQVYTASISPDDPVWLQPPQDVAEEITFGSDTRFLISWGPFNIQPDSSTRLLFTTFTADNVHNFALNLLNLPDQPYGYAANLNFTDLLLNSARAEERAEFLLNPLMPVTGLHLAHHDNDSAVLAWDPWVFDNIDGYEVYLSEIPDEWLPYPGLPAPWLRPQTLEPVASLDITNRYKLPPLDPNKFYFVNVAHRSQSQIGSEGVPLMIGRPSPGPAPQPEFDYAYFYNGGTLHIAFTDSTGWDVDHYRIYKLTDNDALENLHRPFYSELIPPSLVPRDSFDIDGTTYYYFAMQPSAIVAAGATSFEDTNPVEGTRYVITAVDKHGFETAFSQAVQSELVYEPTRDILVISGLPYVSLTSYDTVRNFYSEILTDYDWEMYHVRDTVQKYECDHELEDCIDWRDFTRFKVTLIDLESYDTFVTKRTEERFHRLKKYILSGGRLAYFGCLYSMNYFYTDKARYYKQDTALVEPYFGADSLFFYFLNYYFWKGLPLDFDSCFGFQWAESARPDLPDIAFDTERYPFGSYVFDRWQDETPPSVSVFVPAENAEVIYRYRSRYPELSWLDGRPVGLRVFADAVDTYLFGFHLWYMPPGQAQQLVQSIFAGLPTETPENTAVSLPESFALRQNYPNPFNPLTEICFDLPKSSRVTLEIYNVLGQRVRTLIDNAIQSAGNHLVQWRADNDSGDKVASGIYFCRLKADSQTATRKMMLLK